MDGVGFSFGTGVVEEGRDKELGESIECSFECCWVNIEAAVVEISARGPRTMEWGTH